MAKVLVLLVLVALCVAAVSTAAHSTPSTLIWIPSTDIQAEGVGHLTLDTYAPSQGRALVDYGVTFGDGRWEYGVDVLSTEGIEDPMRLNAKLLVVDESRRTPRLTVGVYDLGGDAASNIVYAMGSRSYSFGRMTVGYGVGKKSVLGGDNTMLLLGFDRALNDKWWFATDYQSGKSAFGALSAGVSYAVNKSTSIIVGYDWYNDRHLSDTLTIQFDVNF